MLSDFLLDSEQEKRFVIPSLPERPPPENMWTHHIRLVLLDLAADLRAGLGVDQGHARPRGVQQGVARGEVDAAIVHARPHSEQK